MSLPIIIRSDLKTSIRFNLILNEKWPGKKGWPELTQHNYVNVQTIFTQSVSIVDFDFFHLKNVEGKSFTYIGL